MEKTIEIPFGAKDSELKGWEYTIPENMKAEIKDGKIIVKQKESEDERIRKSLVEYFHGVYDKHTCLNNADLRWEGLEVKKVIAYLERQKPVQDREEREYVRTLKSLIADFLRDKEDVNRGYYQDIYNWLDGRHIEQQPVNDRYTKGYMDGYAKGFKNAENSYNRGVSYHFDNPNIQRFDPNMVIESKTGGTYPDILEGTLTGGKSIEDKDAIEDAYK